MPKYFKREAESDHGVGVAYLEVTDGWPTRQVENYDEIWLWGDDQHPEHLADQPLDVLELSTEHEIDVREFEQVWSRARSDEPGRRT